VSRDDIGSELYGLPLDQFIGARNARAKELSASGDRDTAAAVRRLSKPSLSAWLANALVRKHPSEIEELLDLGRDLRRAQERAAGDEMRRLSARRQELVQRMVTLAAAEAGAGGQHFGAQVQRQLEGTLEAAVAEQSASEELRAGTLTDALSHVGFGEVSTLQRGAREGSKGQDREPDKGSGAGKPTRMPRRARADPRSLDRAERALAQARAALEASRADLDKANGRHRLASIRQRQAATELRAAERELAHASAALDTARQRRQREERSVKAAENERRRAAGSR
jgi:hypothetical protein